MEIVKSADLYYCACDRIAYYLVSDVGYYCFDCLALLTDIYAINGAKRVSYYGKAMEEIVRKTLPISPTNRSGTEGAPHPKDKIKSPKGILLPAKLNNHYLMNIKINYKYIRIWSNKT